MLTQVEKAHRRMIRQLWEMGARALGPSGRGLLGIRQETCECCNGNGVVWSVPTQVQAEAWVDNQGNRLPGSTQPYSGAEDI